MESKEFSANLGSNRYVKICQWKGEKRVDLREWEGNKPTKKGISLPLMRWKFLLDHIQYVDEALKNHKAYVHHLGGNVFCTVTTNSPCVDIRQYWTPTEEIVPSTNRLCLNLNDIRHYWKPTEKFVPCKKGLCLRPNEYRRLKEILPDITAAIPELNIVEPCFYQSDHATRSGYLRCSECNPSDFIKWQQQQ